MLIKYRGAIQRFTPTPVGNMLNVSYRAKACAVHPHACGEYYFSLAVGARQSGSPPRLWGIWHLHYIGGDYPRFTPTPVGNIDFSSFVINAAPVHPHACGEYAIVAERYA